MREPLHRACARPHLPLRFSAFHSCSRCEASQGERGRVSRPRARSLVRARCHPSSGSTARPGLGNQPLVPLRRRAQRCRHARSRATQDWLKRRRTSKPPTRAIHQDSPRRMPRGRTRSSVKRRWTRSAAGEGRRERPPRTPSGGAVLARLCGVCRVEGAGRVGCRFGSTRRAGQRLRHCVGHESCDRRDGAGWRQRRVLPRSRLSPAGRRLPLFSAGGGLHDGAVGEDLRLPADVPGWRDRWGFGNPGTLRTRNAT